MHRHRRNSESAAGPGAMGGRQLMTASLKITRFPNAKSLQGFGVVDRYAVLLKPMRAYGVRAALLQIAGVLLGTTSYPNSF